MEFCGFQKLTLLDFPGHTAATVFTGGCNLRCPFCHNEPLVLEFSRIETIPEDTVLAFLKKRQGILDGLAITGGEPMLQPELRAFIEKVRALGMAVKLDTNGFFPARLRELLEAGLVDYVAVDIKNCKEKYALTTGIPNLSTAPIEETVELLRASGVPYEFRTTVVREFHDLCDLEKIAQWIRGCPRYYLQNFEDSGALIGSGLHALPEEKLRRAQEICAPYVDLCQIRGLG